MAKVQVQTLVEEKLGQHSYANTPGKVAQCRFGCGARISADGSFHAPAGVDPYGSCPGNKQY